MFSDVYPGDAAGSLSPCSALSWERPLAWLEEDSLLSSQPHRTVGVPRGGSSSSGRNGRNGSTAAGERSARAQRSREPEYDDEDLLATGKDDLEELVRGTGPWVNISPVIRNMFRVLQTLSKTQARHVEQLQNKVASLEVALESKASREELQAGLQRVENSISNHTEDCKYSLKRLEERVELKADSSFVTDCLMTKANRSDLAQTNALVERTITKAQSQLNAKADDSQATLRQVVERVQARVLAQDNRFDSLASALQDLESLRKAARDSAEHVQAQVRQVMDRETKAQRDKLSQIANNLYLELKKDTMEAVGKKELAGQRQVNDLTRQVEKLSAVQSSTQTLMLQVEERLSQTALRDDLARLQADKANKLSVASAVHRKANKAEVSEQCQALEQRLSSLERQVRLRSGLGNSFRESTGAATNKGLGAKPPTFTSEQGLAASRISDFGGSESGAESKGKLAREVQRLRESLRETQDALADFPDREQVGIAMDKLNEKLTKDMDSLRLSVERVKATLTAPGRSAGEVEGKLRATSELCQRAMARIEGLHQRLSGVEDELAHANPSPPLGTLPFAPKVAMHTQTGDSNQQQQAGFDHDFFADNADTEKDLTSIPKGKTATGPTTKPPAKRTLKKKPKQP